MELPEDERAALAAILEDSLGDGSPQEDIDAAWSAEIQRRLAAARSGEVELVPTEEVERELEEILEQAKEPQRAAGRAMRVILLPPARRELRAATTWYAARSRVAARRFIDEYKRVRGLAAHAPLQWAEIEPGVRRVLFRKYPFAPIHTVEGSRVLVLAVKHHKQDPEYWHER